MRDYVFNEKRDIEYIISNNIVDDKNLCNTIKKISRYNYYVLGLSKEDSYKVINEYMTKNCSDYVEVEYYKMIDGCIKDAPKGSWKNIDNIIITKQELDKIALLNDLKKEKIAFVLLADAKYNNACGNFKSNRSYLSFRDLYNQARVTMPVKDRAIYLHFLYESKLVADDESEFRKDGMKLNYISESDDDVELILTENSYKELAFTYLNYKKGGYKECKSCGRLFRIRKNTQYCKQCTPKYEKIEEKTIKCVDCGKTVYVNTMDTKTIRCEECYNAYRKKQNLQAVRKYQQKL